MDILRFQQIATIVLAGITGLLIALPIGLPKGPEASMLYALGGLLFGAVSGYRRRNSKIFMYFCMIASAVLSTLLIFYGFKAT